MRCGYCEAQLAFSDGEDIAGRDRGGNARETTRYRCTGCHRRFSRSVSERFDGHTEAWAVAEGEGTWTALPEEKIPRR